MTAGILRGRKQGMSEELLSLLMWIAILLCCAVAYEPVAGLLLQTTTMFSMLSGYLMAYMVVAALIVVIFALLKRGIGGKLLGSDIFGGAEYYLGMGAGLLRFVCMLLTALALLNARYFNPLEVRAMEKFQNDEYGSNYFPTFHSLQASVFERSLTGPWIRNNLGFLLIKRTEPESKRFQQKEFTIP
jgi:uncharacterized membrane protein required for colicin V production